jgi:hypothetical protein
VRVQAVPAAIQPDHVAAYKIAVWQRGGTPADMTVQITAGSSQSPSGLPQPAFTACPEGIGTQTCALGTVNADQFTRLRAQVRVPGSVKPGGTVTLSATVIRAVWKLHPVSTVATATATTQVMAAHPVPPSPMPSGSPSPGGGHPGSSSPQPASSPPASTHQAAGDPTGKTSAGHPGYTNSQLGDGLGGIFAKYRTEPLGDRAGARSPGSVANLFPLVGPSPSPSSPAGSHPRRATGRYPMAATSDILPLGPAGGQVAGLILLAAGVLVALVRFRRPRGARNRS